MVFLLFPLLTLVLTWRIILVDRRVVRKRQILMLWLALTCAAPVVVAFWQGGTDLSKAARQGLMSAAVLLVLGLGVALLQVSFDMPSAGLMFIPAIWYAATSGPNGVLQEHDQLPPR